MSSQSKYQPRAEYGAYGGNPLLHQFSNQSNISGPSGAALQPGNYKVVDRDRANPAPLGLAGFALTTFVLAMVTLGVRGTVTPNLVVGPAFAYGGLVQLLAGMWEMAFGNTFGALALSSYGGFWISVGIIFTPGGFNIQDSYENTGDFYTVFGLYLYGWMIFTIILWILTLRSTLIFMMLFLTVWLTFFCLATGYLYNSGGAEAMPQPGWNKAGGVFAIVAAFLAWWVMLAGVLNKNNSFFEIPLFEFPWSVRGMQIRHSWHEEGEEEDAVSPRSSNNGFKSE